MSEKTEKVYELRPLVATDMGIICNIISAIGIKEFRNSFNLKDFQARVLEWGAIAFSSRRRGEIKRGESKLASNQFPMCSPQSGPLGEVHGVTKRREEGGRRQR